MSSDDLITWKPEPVEVPDAWGDLLEENRISDEQMYKFNVQAIHDERKRIAAENELDTKNASEIAEMYRVGMDELEKAALPAKQINAVHQFITEAPEFVLCPKNQQRIDQYFAAAGLDGSSPDHFHKAYTALASRGLVQVDESKRPRQPRKTITRADLESMPLEQLAELAGTK